MPTSKKTPAPAHEAETGEQPPATPEPAKADDTGTHVEPGTPDTDGNWEPINPLTADDITAMRNEHHTTTGATRWNPTTGLQYRGEAPAEPAS